MKKRFVALALCIAALLIPAGCSSILDDEMLIVTAHEKPTATTSESVVEANTYDDLKEKILDFIMAREETGLIRANNYEGDINDDVNRACIEMLRDNPFAAFAVASITGKANRVVSYHEVVMTIDYNSDVTKKQLESIITVSTLRSLRSVLQDKLAGYAPSLTVLTKDIPLSEDDKDAMVQEIYYENPMVIVMMPITTLEFYPTQGTDRIADFNFGYSRYESSTLIAMADSLENKARRVAESVTGGSDDGAILLSLCQKLTGSTEYDTALAQSGDYSNQNIAATAYGALINGSAVGEGYAMAYKALCDELGLECYVVIGKLDGKPHAWNIVELDGNYYHVDASMCDVDGLEAAFMKNDTEMRKNYVWDRANYKICAGPPYEIPPAAEETADSSPADAT